MSTFSFLKKNNTCICLTICEEALREHFFSKRQENKRFLYDNLGEKKLFDTEKKLLKIVKEY